MSQTKDSYSLYKCETCGNQISGITKNQQSSPSSVLWSRYGLCSPGCLATESTLRKHNDISKQLTREELEKEDISNINRFDNQSIIEGSLTGSLTEKTKYKKPAWQSIISGGRIIGGVAIVSGIILYYTEFYIGALTCLVFLVLAVILCRIGVWKKCRIR